MKYTDRRENKSTTRILTRHKGGNGHLNLQRRIFNGSNPKHGTCMLQHSLRDKAAVGLQGGLQAASISSKLVPGHRNTGMGCHTVCSSNEVPRGQMLSACQSSIFLLGASTCATSTGEQVSLRRLQTGPDLPSNSRGRPVLPSTYWVRPYTHTDSLFLIFFFPDLS